MTQPLIVSEIIDDLRVADEALRRFERLYWLSSGQFFELYNQGVKRLIGSHSLTAAFEPRASQGREAEKLSP